MGGGELDRSERPRRVLVTGGAGFIGSHVVDAFLARGDEVWVVDDLSSGKRENVQDAATFVEMGIEDPGLRDLCVEIGFDVINHHAAQIDVRVSVTDPARDARTNVIGLLNVLEGARLSEAERVIYISSGGVVYGEPEERPTPESAPKLPRSPYGVSKLAGEYYLNYYREIHGMEYVALRYSNVYGPRQDPHGEAGVVAIFSQRLLAGEELLIYGDGEQTRDYIFVGDVVRANLLAAGLRLPEGTGLDSRGFNVGTGVETSVNRLADILESVSGLRHGRSFRAARKGELRYSSLDPSRLQRAGWAPGTSLADGLRETFRWIQSRSAAATLTEGAVPTAPEATS
ncbi:MAG: NAD-dependent epimerase/dehydratase family protein [Gemmatimonadales bacterium]|nr:MAG: NAD-dependent epimerase/dehydratase family protein [Gemmatimonadales bacterium]